MILTQTAIAAVRKNSSIRMKLAEALGCTDFTIIRYLANNSDNLTKAAALKIIKQETGLSEKQILVEETQVSTSKVS